MIHWRMVANNNKEQWTTQIMTNKQFFFQTKTRQKPAQRDRSAPERYTKIIQ